MSILKQSHSLTHTSPATAAAAPGTRCPTGFHQIEDRRLEARARQRAAPQTMQHELCWGAAESPLQSSATAKGEGFHLRPAVLARVNAAEAHARVADEKSWALHPGHRRKRGVQRPWTGSCCQRWRRAVLLAFDSFWSREKPLSQGGQGQCLTRTRNCQRVNKAHSRRQSWRAYDVGRWSAADETAEATASRCGQCVKPLPTACSNSAHAAANLLQIQQQPSIRLRWMGRGLRRVGLRQVNGKSAQLQLVAVHAAKCYNLL